MQNEGDIKDAFIVNNQSAIRKQQSGNLQNQPQNSERALSRLRARAKEISSHQRDLNFAPLLFCLALTLLLLTNSFAEEDDLLGIARKLIGRFENGRQPL